MIDKVKDPLYVIFLLIAGALWHPQNYEALILALLFVGIRLIAKWFALVFSSQLTGETVFGGRMVFGLISPGAMAIAIAVNFYLFGGQFAYTQLALDVVVWAFVLFVPLGGIVSRFAVPRKDFR